MVVKGTRVGEKAGRKFTATETKDSQCRELRGGGEREPTRVEVGVERLDVVRLYSNEYKRNCLSWADFITRGIFLS